MRPASLEALPPRIREWIRATATLSRQGVAGLPFMGWRHCAERSAMVAVGRESHCCLTTVRQQSSLAQAEIPWSCIATTRLGPSEHEPATFRPPTYYKTKDLLQLRDTA